MTADEAVVAVIGALESFGSLYALVGSRAANFRGIPRSTRDADTKLRWGQHAHRSKDLDDARNVMAV